MESTITQNGALYALHHGKKGSHRVRIPPRKLTRACEVAPERVARPIATAQRETVDYAVRVLVAGLLPWLRRT